MIKNFEEGSHHQDHNVMEVATTLVNDVIEKAREEVIKRTSVSQPRASSSDQASSTKPARGTGNVPPLRRLSQWQNRAQGVIRRFLTSLCLRIQGMTR